MTSAVEREITCLTPWSAATMAGLALAGVKFTPKVDSAAHLWVARWGVPGERDERMLTDGELWRLVHKVALAFGPRT